MENLTRISREDREGCEVLRSRWGERPREPWLSECCDPDEPELETTAEIEQKVTKRTKAG
jgi:hypothetical protein